MFNQMKVNIVFSKIELRLGYHQVHIKEADVQKTTFSMRYGNYELTMVPFGLTNAPTTLMFLMNNIFSQLLDKFVLVFLNDIIIYSKSEVKNEKHLRLILQILRDHQLYAKLNICSFYQSRV